MQTGLKPEGELASPLDDARALTEAVLMLA